jgi:hypothetical protein
MNGDIVTAGLEPAGKGDACLGRQIDVKYLLALLAVKVAVILHVWAKSRRAAFHGHFTGKTGFYQGIKTVVNRCHGNLRQLAFSAKKNFLGRGMIPRLAQHFVDVQPLRRESKAAISQPLVDTRGHLIVFSRAHWQ